MHIYQITTNTFIDLKAYNIKKYFQNKQVEQNYSQFYLKVL